MKLHVELVFGFDPPITDVDAFHDSGEQLMIELEKLDECNDDIFDPAVSTEADTAQLIVELVYSGASTARQAIEKTLTVIRTAAHAAGFETKGWPKSSELEPLAISADPVDVPALV